MSARRELLCGIDDAGRGPVIGPMVLAGVAFYGDRLSILRGLGVRDSKALSPSARQRLSGQILCAADGVEVEVVQPGEIDEYVRRRQKLWKLNRLEAERAARLLQRLKPDVAYIDAPDVDAGRFGGIVGDMLTARIRIISEHHADETYPLVSAASIIATPIRSFTLDSGLKNSHLSSSVASTPAATQPPLASGTTRRTIPSTTGRGAS